MGDWLLVGEGLGDPVILGLCVNDGVRDCVCEALCVLEGDGVAVELGVLVGLAVRVSETD